MDGEEDGVEGLAGEPVWVIAHGQDSPVDGDGGIHGVEHGIPLAGGIGGNS